VKISRAFARTSRLVATGSVRRAFTVPPLG
jgi:hypothetical protein